MPPRRPKRVCQEPQLAGIGAGTYWMHRGLVYLGRARCFGGRLAVVSGWPAVPSYFCVFRIQQHNLPWQDALPVVLEATMPQCRPRKPPKPQASSGLHCVRCVRRSAGYGNATSPRRPLTQPSYELGTYVGRSPHRGTSSAILSSSPTIHRPPYTTHNAQSIIHNYWCWRAHMKPGIVPWCIKDGWY